MTDEQFNAAFAAIFWFTIMVVIGATSVQQTLAGEPASWAVFLFMGVSLVGLVVSLVTFCKDIE